MKNALITTMMLKSYGLSLLNRGEDGFGKQGIYGGVNRARVSSQCLKKALRKMGVFNENIRSAHLEDLIEKILSEMIQSGSIDEKDVDSYGTKICEALGCDWSKKGNQGKDAEKKRTIAVTSFAEVLAVVNAATSVKTTDEKEIKKAITEALSKTRISAEKAMFGTMVASKDSELKTVDGATQIGQSFSIDEYAPENDFIAATFEGGKADDSDPFYGSLNDFIVERKTESGSETLTNSWMNANVMFTPTCINVNELIRNLSQSTNHTDLEIAKDMVLADAKTCITDFLENLPITDPSAKQNSCSSHPAPSIYYIEFIKNGNCQYTDFEKVIRRNNKGITEQGIERILEFAQDMTFRRGEIERYVMLSGPYKNYEKEFEAVGVKVVHSLNDLSTIVNTETERLVSE